MSQSQENDYALLQEVVNNTTSAIIVVSETGVIVKANQSALNLLGEETLQGRRWVEVISKVFRPRNDDGHEISTRDGKRLQVTTVSLSSGQLIQMNDLTETRLLQDKLSHMERLSSLGRMAASLAHQIRTPLSAAMLYAANLGNANLQPMARKRFQEKLVSRLEALEAQVSDILMFARSNEQTVALIDASQLVEQACNNVTAVLTKGGAQMATQIDEGPMSIMGNATALTGALSNLIANAVEAGAKRIILKLTRTKEAVVFSVANDGPRIPDELKEKIFEPFYTSKSSGTGLGLAVVSAVTKVHQGVLSLDEWNETFATVFNIAIPLFESDQVVANSAPENSVSNNGELAANNSQASSANQDAQDMNSPSANGASVNEPSINGASVNEPSINGASVNEPSINEQQISMLRGAQDKMGLAAQDEHHSHIIGIGTIEGTKSIRVVNADSDTDIENSKLGSLSEDIAMQQQAAAIFNQNHYANENIISEDKSLQSGASFAHSSAFSHNDNLSTPSFGSLPPTAEGISKQAANEANNATSQAFAAYARKHQQQFAAQKAALEQTKTDSLNDGFTHVEIDVPHRHKIN
ncbi:PAS domain-containing sensor histidine kinase [Anaerobiospirillum sp. NML120448]|uniref:sensor histidine kinase n=1 Tax=Anaerobiospirillum sp. NML120448 TaxID=2932816 RepID=UPI001FF2569A|nr:PAS domain-containing sensor histidine kinase [Anaerobiospirillum sp. NML120448]MCK0513382.1 PAS domain-containing sensor histidine kinase [Anaerobiospirillum sp. NML120448]